MARCSNPTRAACALSLLFPTRIVGAIARITRVCSYERAGYGFSDRAPLQRTTAAIVDDLHNLLRAANVSPPYVMVGHSMAGLDVRLYADRYSSEVVGLVLVDPLVEGWDSFVQHMFPKSVADDNLFLASLANCEQLAQEHQLQARIGGQSRLSSASRLSLYGIGSKGARRHQTAPGLLGRSPIRSSQERTMLTSWSRPRPRDHMA